MNPSFKNFTRNFFLGCFALCLFSLGGCVRRPQPAGEDLDQARNTPAYLEHKVSFNGETLIGISTWYTGKSSNWVKIRDANPQLKPNRLPLGAVVRIPMELVSRSQPLPKRMVTTGLPGGESEKPVDSVRVTPRGGEVGGEVKEENQPAAVSVKKAARQPASPPAAETVKPTVVKEPAPPIAQPKAAEAPAPTPVMTSPKEIKESTPPSLPPPAPPQAVDIHPAETVKPPPPSVDSPVKQLPPAEGGDKEREKLLDDLLSQ